MNGHGLEQIAAHEHELTTYALQRLKEIPQMRIFGEAAERGAVISFLVGDIHHFDLGTLLDLSLIHILNISHKISLPRKVWVWKTCWKKYCSKRKCST